MVAGGLVWNRLKSPYAELLDATMFVALAVRTRLPFTIFQRISETHGCDHGIASAEWTAVNCCGHGV
jgi:hypothetical protein